MCDCKYDDPKNMEKKKSTIKRMGRTMSPTIIK